MKAKRQTQWRQCVRHNGVDFTTAEPVKDLQRNQRHSQIRRSNVDRMGRLINRTDDQTTFNMRCGSTTGRRIIQSVCYVGVLRKTSVKLNMYFSARSNVFLAWEAMIISVVFVKIQHCKVIMKSTHRVQISITTDVVHLTLSQEGYL